MRGVSGFLQRESSQYRECILPYTNFKEGGITWKSVLKPIVHTGDLHTGDLHTGDLTHWGPTHGGPYTRGTLHTGDLTHGGPTNGELKKETFLDQ